MCIDLETGQLHLHELHSAYPVNPSLSNELHFRLQRPSQVLLHELKLVWKEKEKVLKRKKNVDLSLQSGGHWPPPPTM